MFRERRTDLRKHKRFRAQDGAFVDLRIRPIKVGKIVDISRGGLAFRYIDVAEGLKEAFELDMYSRHNEFRMEKVPVKTIWDRETAGELSFSTRTRLRGVQFGKLTQNQFSELERFLLLNTIPQEERMGTIH
jgi:hypothetical protein